MNYYVDGWTNFCRVFELPDSFSSDFCMGGGIPTTFIMVDWFCPVQGIGQPTVSKKEWIAHFGDLKDMEDMINGDSLREQLAVFLRKKNYVKPGKMYVVICDFNFSFTFKG